MASGRAGQPDDQSPGHSTRHSRDPTTDRRGHQRQRHAALCAEHVRTGGAARTCRGWRRLPPAEETCGVWPAWPVSSSAGSIQRSMLSPRTVGRGVECEGAKLAAGPERQGRDCQRQAHLPALPGAGQQPALAGSGRPWRSNTTAAVGQHGYQESQLSRRRSTSKSSSALIPSTRFRRRR